MLVVVGVLNLPLNIIIIIIIVIIIVFITITFIVKVARVVNLKLVFSD